MMDDDQIAKAKARRILMFTAVEDVGNLLMNKYNMPFTYCIATLDITRMLMLKTAETLGKPISPEFLAQTYEAVCAEKELLDEI